MPMILGLKLPEPPARADYLRAISHCDAYGTMLHRKQRAVCDEIADRLSRILRMRTWVPSYGERPKS